MILYGSSMSPYVRKVLACAAEKGITLESRPTGFRDENPEFRAASPFGKMPALVDGDYNLADSSAIIHYLEAKHPEPALIPAEPRARGRTIWWDEFGDTLLMGCLQKLFFNRVVAPILLKREGDPEVADAAEKRELPPLLSYLEGQVPEGGFLVGDRLTLADVAVASPLANLEHMGMTVDGGRYPRLAAYVERILARPSFVERLTKERAFMQKVAA
ncbi:MAG: Glutathione S-transferase family protein [uncultured Sphingomonas sp.]|uniref:Glutathione S-transferase family protein n=1 Tax=uncultured Sphingomonas sp. TaxID=158754 RepID=A0A6J4T054_9SPHN|nr:glutathione S-transferase family protein [uncultured Sphingomonas sp.]CAA9509654.1 MAG: Glutathione S-transferase family protein [uncultured Sphingomonas sp.]